jgi:hypothetical protein
MSSQYPSESSRKHRLIFLIGGCGGISPTLLNIAFHPFTFFVSFRNAAHWIGWSASIIIFFAVGGFVAWLAERRSPLKAFYLGIAAPSIIFTIAYQTGFFQTPRTMTEFERVEPSYQEGISRVINCDDSEYEDPFKVPRGWQEIRLRPERMTTMPREFFRPVEPHNVYVYFALAKYTGGTYSLPISFCLQDGDTFHVSKTIEIYRGIDDSVVKDNVILIPISPVSPDTYRFEIKVNTVDTALTRCGSLSFTSGEWVTMAVIIDLVKDDITVHKARNLENIETAIWVMDLVDKGDEAQKGFLHNFWEGLLKFFF